MINFLNPDYLKKGSKIQQKAHAALRDLGVFKKLENFQPVLTGTIPLNLYVPSSDLDIICHVNDFEEFKSILQESYGKELGFFLKEKTINKEPTVICGFHFKHFPVEIFGQNVPTIKQTAYLHLCIEHKILLKRGNEFKDRVLKLKLKGVKTEPAFAKLLGLEGDPYQALLTVSV